MANCLGGAVVDGPRVPLVSRRVLQLPVQGVQELHRDVFDLIDDEPPHVLDSGVEQVHG